MALPSSSDIANELALWQFGPTLALLAFEVDNLFLWNFYMMPGSPSGLFPLEAHSTHHSQLQQLKMSPNFAKYALRGKIVSKNHCFWMKIFVFLREIILFIIVSFLILEKDLKKLMRKNIVWHICQFTN